MKRLKEYYFQNRKMQDKRSITINFFQAILTIFWKTFDFLISAENTAYNLSFTIIIHQMMDKSIIKKLTQTVVLVILLVAYIQKLI